MDYEEIKGRINKKLKQIEILKKEQISISEKIVKRL